MPYESLAGRIQTTTTTKQQSSQKISTSLTCLDELLCQALKVLGEKFQRHSVAQAKANLGAYSPPRPTKPLGLLTSYFTKALETSLHAQHNANRQLCMSQSHMGASEVLRQEVQGHSVAPAKADLGAVVTTPVNYVT
jgi:hypothetical protein